MDYIIEYNTEYIPYGSYDEINYDAYKINDTRVQLKCEEYYLFDCQNDIIVNCAENEFVMKKSMHSFPSLITFGTPLFIDKKYLSDVKIYLYRDLEYLKQHMNKLSDDERTQILNESNQRFELVRLLYQRATKVPNVRTPDDKVLILLRGIYESLCKNGDEHDKMIAYIRDNCCYSLEGDEKLLGFEQKEMKPYTEIECMIHHWDVKIIREDPDVTKYLTNWTKSIVYDSAPLSIDIQYKFANYQDLAEVLKTKYDYDLQFPSNVYYPTYVKKTTNEYEKDIDDMDKKIQNFINQGAISLEYI